MYTAVSQPLGSSQCMWGDKKKDWQRLRTKTVPVVWSEEGWEMDTS